MSIASKTQQIYTGCADIRDAIKEADSTLGGGIITTLGNDIRKILNATTVLMKNPYRVVRVLNNGTTATALYGNSKVTTSDVTDVIIPSGITVISNNCLRDCSGLKNILIPDTVTTIGSYSLAGCTGIEKNLLLPSNLTSVAGFAFDNTNITSINGSNVLEADTVRLDCMCRTNISNLTVNATSVYTGYFVSDSVAHSGTLTINCTNLYANGNGQQNSQRGAMPNYEHIVINGDLRFNSTFYYSGITPYAGVLKSLRITGNVIGNGSAVVGLYNPNNSTCASFAFLEILGTISGIGKDGSGNQYGMFYTNDQRSLSANTIVHLGYNGLACSIPKFVGGNQSRVTKVYVGDGSSAEHDNSILALYTADSGWASYTSKLDTWYNYVQSGGTYA